MNILFLTPTEEDYLSDTILHGLKSLDGVNVVDYPKRDILYSNYGQDAIQKLYGRGFSVYGLLEDIPVDRNRIIEKIRSRFFDLIVFGSICRQFGWFYQLLPLLHLQRTIILDGEDSPRVYPASGEWWRRYYYWFTPRVHNRFLYFKREWTPHSRFSLICRFLPNGFLRRFPYARKLRPINFSIPREKIISQIPEKLKKFPRHIVDKEVCGHVAGSVEGYAFASEREYYADLQQSKFGVTMKRGGWDCMRHYEVAANAAIPCFRNLDEKPDTCAPHGLNSLNSVSYKSWEELRDKIDRLTDAECTNIQMQVLSWAHENSTETNARRVLDEAMSS